MEQLSFKCKKCGIVHTLGKDSIVTMATEITLGALATTDFGLASALDDTRQHPDMVGRLPRSWSSLTKEEVRKHEADIARIKVNLATGKPRWYQCWECKTVQTYAIMR